MRPNSISARILLAAAMTALLSGCLTRRTVTSGGRTVESKYVVKRPIKEVIRNSQ